MLPVRRFLLLPLLLVLSLTACAERQEDTPRDSADSSGFPVELKPEGAPAVTLEERPERIVSLSPSATEVLYAVGAGDQVVAVDEMSTIPEQAPRTEMSGLNPDPQRIAAHDPDLVVVESDTDGKLADALAKTGTPTLVLRAPETLDAMYAQFELVGKATGHASEGEDLARRTKEEIEKLVADAGNAGENLSYYHELDPSYYSVTSETFIGQIYGLFGLTNIADRDDPSAHGGYPQLSAETILSADPDLVFLADTQCCGQTAETVAKRPGWDTLTAVREHRVIELQEDSASRWTPRIVDFVRTVADGVAKVAD
ncbi:ABC transporter substrate-binding protein [Saccharomonospora glauca]|jgi:iron complex transport system substrate-binding protein|uniref:ABC-type Fe3+-hydroxamate transport system, periplasmic component n=1 Tax=Saccharomonospora glauca K62 TaxID=928724 RepID=I1D522_9PSEU|nr:ABC transporter substrate-binding protein [Saccharomonospora glauca]EIF00047.1 ABC-type Fe3+-hydroxamate transport system, periplasmic component [Saccharomonospora glauca K62]